MKLPSLIALLLAFLSQLIAPAANARQVEDLALGVALYEFFQQNDFEAISELLVGEELDRLQNQSEFSSQLTTGIMLSYGMDKEAARRLADFNSDEHTNNENLSRSNYYLAKLLYRKGDYEQAYDALGRVDKSLTKDLQAEMSFLLNNSFLMAGFAAETGALVKAEAPFKLPSSKRLAVWGDYNQYNQLVFALSGSQTDSYSNTSMARLERLAQNLSSSIERLDGGTQDTQFSELLALRDRTLLSIAYLQLQQNNPRQAIRHLRQYSADGVEYNEAMLAFGWAALQQEDFSRTIASWSQLLDQDTASPATREALLGMGFVLQKQNKKTAAVNAYDLAIGRFTKEIAVLQDLQPLLTVEKLEPFLQALQSQSVSWLNDYQSDDWDKLSQTLLDDELVFAQTYSGDNDTVGAEQYMTLLNRLHNLISTQEFVVLLNQHRDLRWLKEKIHTWSDDLDAIGDALENQRERFVSVFDEGQKLDMEADYAAQAELIEQLRGELALASKPDYVRLMDAKESERLLKLQAIPNRLLALRDEYQALIGAGADANKLRSVTKQIEQSKGYADLARLMEGYQVWSVAEQQDQRLWDFEKQLRTGEKNLTLAKSSLDNIERLVPEQTTQSRGVMAVADLADRSNELLTQLEQSNGEALLSLRSMLDDSVNQQIASLQAYLAQANLAKARLLDEQFMLQDEGPQTLAQHDATTAVLAE